MPASTTGSSTTGRTTIISRTRWVTLRLPLTSSCRGLYLDGHFRSCGDFEVVTAALVWSMLLYALRPWRGACPPGEAPRDASGHPQR